MRQHGQRGRGDKGAGHTDPHHRGGSLAELPPADPHPAVEQDDRQRDGHHPLDGGDRHLPKGRHDIRGDRGSQQEDRRSGDPDPFADPVRHHRPHQGGGGEQDDQREVLDVVHRSAQLPASLGRPDSSVRFLPAPNTPGSCDNLPSHPANQNKQSAADHGSDAPISPVIRDDHLVPGRWRDQLGCRGGDPGPHRSQTRPRPNADLHPQAGTAWSPAPQNEPQTPARR
jgi:hypothetical protein